MNHEMSDSATTTYTTGEICQRVGGELVGTPDLRIAGVDSVDRAGAAQITLIGNTEFELQAGEGTREQLTLYPS